MDDIRSLMTEQPNAAAAGLDQMTAFEFVQLMNRMDGQAVQAVAGAQADVARAIELIAGRMAYGGRLFYAGAGTSGRLGVLDASECPPTFGVEEEMVQGVIAGGEVALRHAVEGAEDDRGAAAGDLSARGFGPKDTLVAISASGRTPYCLGALEHAKKLGAATVSLSCNRHTPMSALADVAIEAVTGSEALAGSTRLKAGTAQKMVLNMLSTGAMVKLGKIYQNEMVDMRPTNEKLRERAVSIVMRTTGINHAPAESALKESGMDIKAAVVMALTGASVGQAIHALEDSRGFVRGAVERISASRMNF